MDSKTNPQKMKLRRLGEGGLTAKNQRSRATARKSTTHQKKRGKNRISRSPNQNFMSDDDDDYDHFSESADDSDLDPDEPVPSEHDYSPEHQSRSSSVNLLLVQQMTTRCVPT